MDKQGKSIAQIQNKSALMLKYNKMTGCLVHSLIGKPATVLAPVSFICLLITHAW